MCEDGNGGFLVYESEKWIVAEGDNLHEKWSAAADAKSNPYRCVVDGITMEWNEISQQWLPAIEVHIFCIHLFSAHHMRPAVFVSRVRL